MIIERRGSQAKGFVLKSLILSPRKREEKKKKKKKKVEIDEKQPFRFPQSDEMKN
jgi:hypothetical protein